MPRFNWINNAAGWAVFVFTTAVYWLTAEPSGSFWDCGEFISCAYKLQVPHSPGAPLFVILAHLITLLAPSASYVALSVNFFSGVVSALTNLFLFWSITALALKLLAVKREELTNEQIVAVIGAGLVGALANGFADSFWFSAVEGEVYALSSFFTALVFWAILKWDQHADEPFADRWLLFIAYMMGLVVGVHLLGLLVIPAIAMVYYFRKTHQPTWFGSLKAFLIGVLVLGFIQYGIIPQIPNLSAKFDILFVNSFGLPFNSGVLFFMLLLAGLIVLGLWYSHRHQKYVLNTATLSLLFIVLGYSTYLMVVLRAQANPSINMGNPSNPITLLSYLNREQYGDRPLLYGQTFASRPYDVDYETGEMRYFRNTQTGKYEELGRKPKFLYESSEKMLFPRIWDNDDPTHIDFYRQWLNLKEGDKPTFRDNLNFFFTYQIGFMYWRYFMWNFSGRQNDIQGHGDIRYGNWKTGFAFLDNAMLGNQSNLPYPLSENRANNRYFLIPFLLGIIGMVYHFRKSKYDAWVVLLLFFFTGLAIVIYLNQTPLQPRERDYAYVGSVWAFCIWLGMSVLWLWEQLQRRLAGWKAPVAATLLAGVAPMLMGWQNWDDHDRSHRHTARDMGSNYLESCAPNAILFTQGDNDTYPLWYAQEVEGIRPDVRIVNLSLLGVDWYIDQLRRRVNQSDPVLIGVDSAAYRGSTRDYVRYYENRAIDQDQYYSLNAVLDFIFSDDPRRQLDMGGQRMNYLPAKNLEIAVDKKAVLEAGVVHVRDTAKIVDRIRWRLNKNTLLKNDLLTLEILRSNLWKRPIYFAISVQSSAYLGLNNYLQQEGLTYRVVPYVTKTSDDPFPGGVQTDIMYENIMNKFKWGGVDKHRVYLDENINRMISNLRSNFTRLANALISEGKKDSAIAVLDKCLEVLPEENVPFSIYHVAIARAYFDAGAVEKGSEIMKRCVEVYSDQLRYYTGLEPRYRRSWTDEINEGIYVLNNALQTAREYNDESLRQQAESAFNRYVSFYTPREEN
ncbi:MAG: DUF2723 domain-containing protein [Chitinophagales bacterium]|nr:DUF2723 domain-containing protein [Chitinophagales bacterium]MDW8392651.1 DUF2723 domain-containing protein [Chitinophagales bacterium]